MKIMNKYVLLLLVACLIVSCDDTWNQHYNQEDYLSGTEVEAYSGSVKSYMESRSDLSMQDDLFRAAGVYDSIADNQEYTIFVYTNDLLNQSAEKDFPGYAQYCVSNVAVSPDELTDGLGIYTRYGKMIWVYKKEGKTYFDDFTIEKCVKTNNAFIYYIKEGVIPVRKKIYEVFKELGEEYSIFKEWVSRYEETSFDREKSTPAGYNAEGNIIYSDSVFTTRNQLLNRYNVDGLEYWNMMDEKFVSTMLVPSNEVIELALDSARARVRRYLGRSMTANDLFKFQDWIVKASFYNKRYYIDDLNGKGDIEAVGEYMKDSLIDKIRPAEPAVWRTTIQRVNTSKMIPASNGIVYFVDHLKIPNYVLIHRLKTEIWKSYNHRDGNQFFELVNWENPTSDTYTRGGDKPPTGYPNRHDYVNFSANPTVEAKRNNLPCSLTFDGIVLNGNTVQKVMLPAGEYFMSLGSRNRLYYSLNVYVNDIPVVKNLSLYGTGADLQQDTWTGNDLDGNPYNGYPETVVGGKPEKVDVWRQRELYGENWGGYDGDGFQIGYATITEEGYFKIRIESDDHARLWTAANPDAKLRLFHWTLRPTKNNY